MRQCGPRGALQGATRACRSAARICGTDMSRGTIVRVATIRRNKLVRGCGLRELFISVISFVAIAICFLPRFSGSITALRLGSSKNSGRTDTPREVHLSSAMRWQVQAFARRGPYCQRVCLQQSSKKACRGLLRVGALRQLLTT